MQAKAYEDMTRKQHEVRAKKVKNKPKVVKTQAKRAKLEANTSKRREKMKRLQSTGHVDDAASLLEDLFKSQ
jgi:competence protein ComGC